MAKPGSLLRKKTCQRIDRIDRIEREESRQHESSRFDENRTAHETSQLRAGLVTFSQVLSVHPRVNGMTRRIQMLSMPMLRMVFFDGA